jgi:hypothetical protein
MTTSRRRRIVVFLGPSLPVTAAESILDTEYRSPAGQGDVYRVLASGVGTIVLIDGVFHQAPSVWQRELLDALEDGITVVGGASMGAIRAAELESFGMRGSGTIFRWYRDGVIDGDDEVALRHADAERARRPAANVVVLADEAARLSPRTVNRMLTGIVGFYELQARRGNTLAKDLLVSTRSGRGAYKPFLHGIARQPAAGSGGAAVRAAELAADAVA